MTFLSAQPPANRRRFGWLLAGLLVVVGLLGACWRPGSTNAALPLFTPASGEHPVADAWAQAKAAGSYHFTSDVTQVTLPLSSIANIGRSSRTETLRLEGENDLRAQRLALTLWADSGTVADPTSGVSVKVENGQTFVRQGAGEWQRHDDAVSAIAPQGDLLSYLTAVRNVTFQGEETRGPAGHTVTFRRYSFEIDGPGFARHLRDQMEATARASGELPADLHLEIPVFYRDMIGTGELWVDEAGLPLRQILTLQFPPQHEEQVQAQIVVDFSRYGTPQPSLIALWQAGDLSGLFHGLTAPLPDPSLLLVNLAALSGLVLMIVYRRTRLVHIMLVALIIFSQVIGPILSSQTQVRFLDAQSAKAAAQTEEQNTARDQRTLAEALGKTEFNPHLNPLEKVAQPVESSPQAALAAPVAAPAALLSDNGVDTDGDGLSDFVEERVGTIATVTDSEFDGLDDKRELQGFNFDNKTWYLNPTSVDSNGDGISDATEWGVQADGSLRSTPLDTDGDKTPDLFDRDNDNDNVPDNKDLAPFAKSSVAYSNSAPLQLTLKNLTANKPTMVEFQVRPQSEKHLWFAFNVLDWPQDSEAQVQDIDGKSYADIAQATNRLPDANEDGGDMKLIPMLEIRMPDASANLSQPADLLPFNITVNNLTTDGQTQVAYVPLTVVTDERSGQRVGFNGQMRYQPTGSWDHPHEVRLVWAVQTLVDLVCDPANQADIARGCQTDGYIHNYPQVIQSYYDDWTLTGLTVREDHGADMAIIYEDPTIDDNLKDDKAIWSLSYVLDHHFLIARDADNNGQRDLTLADIDQRFDHTRNGSVSEDQRFAVPNLLRVAKKSYTTIEQAVASTAMTETQTILANFVTATTADRDVKPLLFFAQETKARLLGTDLLSAPGNYASESGAALTLDMAPGGQTAQPVEVMAGLKWAGYCGSTALPLTWQGCSAEEYWNTLAQRYENLPSLPDDESPDWVKGRLQLAQLYYLAFTTGNYRVVQRGVELAPFAYSLDSEATTTSQVRAVLQGLSLVPLEAALGFERAFAVVLSSAFLRKQGVIQYGITLYDGLKKSKAAVANAKLGNNQKLIAAEVKDLKLKQHGALKFFGSPFATIGAMFSIAAQIASLSPTVPLTDRTILGTLSLVTNLAVNVVLTSAEVGMGIRAGKATVKDVLNGTVKVAKAVKIGNAVGLVITVVATWGFLIYSAVSSGTAAGTPALNKAAVEAIAATIIAVVLFALAFTVVGLIITLIFAVIEGILTLICELGVDQLRVLGGACFTFTTAAIKAAGYFIYNSDIMVDLERDDLVTAGAPDIALQNPNVGFVDGNALTITLPVTITLYHKDADAKNGLMIFFYHYLFSSDNLKSSTFQYSLTHPGPFTHAPGRNEMTNQWQDVVEDHKQNNVQPMYRGYARTAVSVGGIELQPGLNQVAQYYFNMGYAVPIYECFVPLPLFIPVCHTDKSSTGSQSTNYETLKFDVFPATLDGFMALTLKGDGGSGLGWDTRFPSLYDSDGDGLRTVAHGGIDPNDGTTDADNDGLTDGYELARRAAGSSLSPIVSDSDSDGLSDFREMELGSDPGVADTDNDGLSDSLELAGWEVTINAQTPLVVHVTADPNQADGDEDGLSDQAERELALSPVPVNRLDQQNRPYHPNVYNTPPIAIFQSTDDVDGILGPNQSFIYTTTVVANQALAPGVLNVTTPNGVSGASDPAALPFDPLTFSGAQTVTNASTLQVNNLPTSEIVLTSTVSTRLPGTPTGNGAQWAWSPATSETNLGSFIDNKAPAFIRGVAATADRQDSYRLLGQTATEPGAFFARGDVWAFDLPGGTTRILESDTDTTTDPDRVDNAAFRSSTSPAIACNESGACLAVWSEQPRCSTVTINWLRVDSAGADGGSGIEPIIFFVADGADTNPVDGGYELLWTPGGAGGGDDLTTGTQRGPNAHNFPIRRTFCEPARLELYETDGITPPNINWATQTRINGHELQSGSGAKEVLFNGDGHIVRLSIDEGPAQGVRLAGALLSPSGTVQRSHFAVSAPTGGNDSSPVIASDGANFLVAWQHLDLYSRQLTANSSTSAFRTELMTRLFDGAGTPLTGETLLTNDRLEFWSAASNTTGALNGTSRMLNRLDLDWIGDRYRLTRGINVGDAAGVPDLQFEDNGGVGLLGAITWRDIDVAGALVAGSKKMVYGLGGNDATASQSLVYNPNNNQLLLVHASGGNLLAQNFSSPSATSANALPWGANVANAVAVYHPATHGYFIGWTNTISPTRPFQYQVRDSALNLVGGNGQALTWPNAVDNEAGTALACPAPQSAPVLELRFEEPPGFGLFQNSATPENLAYCDVGACPTAGLIGAPNAPLSDYAVRFDGVNNRIWLMNTVAPASFSVAVWVKAAAGANSDSLLIDQGATLANGWSFFLSGGKPALRIGTTQTLVAPNSIEDNQWHLLVATRSIRTGAVALYVDGLAVASNTFSTVLLNGVTLSVAGGAQGGGRFFKGQMDHLQIYSAALSANTVSALFQRTLQSYCVASATPQTGNSFAWSRLALTEQDTRGGRISVSQGLPLLVDRDPPTATIAAPANNSVIPANATTIIGGNAVDPLRVAGLTPSGVGQVEVQVNGGAWQPAEGAAAWSFALTAGTANLTIRVRATDNAGNVGPESTPITLRPDGAAPQVTLNAPANTIVPTQNNDGEWLVTLGGTANDGAGSGVKPGSVEVRLTQRSGVGPILPWQPATLSGNSWTISYALPAGMEPLTGAYDVQVRANDNLDNRTADNAATGVVRLDNTAPEAFITAIAGQDPGAQLVISQTLTLSGVVTDSNSLAGLQSLEIAFTPIEQIAALPDGVTGDAAEALLNRPWQSITLAQSGPGKAVSTWSFPVPAGLENQYQINLRATDVLGNRSVSGNAWRGAIDTLDPRVSMTATATGASYFDAASNQTMNEIRFVCTATDRHLTEARFVCPGNSLQPPVRTFTDDPALQALFPDQTIRSGLANTYTLWLSTTTPVASVSACDVVGRCATASTGAAGVAAAGAELVEAAAAPGAPTAVVVNPTNGRFVAAGNAISVTVAAEAGAGLKEVTIKLDNATVQTLNFAQSPAITRTLRTVNVPVASEGPHTLVAQATAWDNSTQTTLFPVVFTLDQNAPSLTIDASALSLADTWQAGSGILRFNGNASDSVGLAAVQIREGSHDFVDATFGNGTWHTALPVADPEGRTLNVTVRAIDRAGRITQLDQAIATDLSAADAPDTTISSSPANPSTVNSAQFAFTGSATTAVFECQLDSGVYTPCASPTSYGDLSKGGHTFRVRAIDSRGLPDLTPAEYTWTVNAGQPDATITGKPTNPTTERTAPFTFSGDATATRFECSLDGRAYAPCTSPKVYNNLGNGEHTFLVRARNSANTAGAADRYVWTVNNLAPVANSQTVIVIPNQAKSITLTATDNEPLLYTIVTPPAHGVLAGLAPNLSYSPDTGYGGPDSFTFKASDGVAESNLATVTLFVDNVPPVVTCSVTPNNLWPPNHKLINVQATVTVTDVHSGPAGFTLISVTSSEADAGLDKDDAPNDRQNWVAGTPDVVGQLRAERSEAGAGRTYTLTYEGKDLAGNKALCTTTVTVPKSQGGRSDATYDENQVLPDAYIDVQPAPVETVSAPVSEAPVTDAQPTGGEAQTLKLFLPFVTNEAVNQ